MELNRGDVERRLARLREAYDPPVTVLDERVPAERFDRLLSAATDGYTGGSYAWTVREPDQAPALSASMPDDAGPDAAHVLLILNRAVDGPTWGLPGGGREDGETYEAAARREVREETGIAVELDEPFQVLRVRTTAHDGDVAAHTLWTFFDAAYAGGTLDPQASELRGVAWFVEPPGEMAGSTARRAAAFWEDYEPPAERVSYGPVDESDPAVDITVRESPGE